jgi:transcriptional regulator with XRE-family HTH domain
MNHDLANAIRSVIKASGLSANELATYSTVDKGIIGRFLKGQRSITIETAQRILTALGCTVEITGPSQTAITEHRFMYVKRKRKRRPRRREKGVS